jgi:hypothetical protein
MGHLISKKINKFENGNSVDADYRSRTDFDLMLKIVQSIQQAKMNYRKQKTSGSPILTL